MSLKERLSLARFLWGLFYPPQIKKLRSVKHWTKGLHHHHQPPHTCILWNPCRGRAALACCQEAHENFCKGPQTCANRSIPLSVNPLQAFSFSFCSCWHRYPITQSASSSILPRFRSHFRVSLVTCWNRRPNLKPSLQGEPLPRLAFHPTPSLGHQRTSPPASRF
jgi:hypothetical protein